MGWGLCEKQGYMRGRACVGGGACARGRAMWEAGPA